MLEFQESYNKKSIYYNVVLIINNKKKKLNVDAYQHTTTGKCGLEGLLYAKKGILAFEKYILSLREKQKDARNIYIEVLWVDNKRRNVYERGLRDCGYLITNSFNYKCLRKKIA